MKKVILGSILYGSGFIGLLVIIIGSLTFPITHNGLAGLKGYLSFFGLVTTFNGFMYISIIGIVILIYEAYLSQLVSLIVAYKKRKS